MKESFLRFAFLGKYLHFALCALKAKNSRETFLKSKLTQLNFRRFVNPSLFEHSRKTFKLQQISIETSMHVHLKKEISLNN